MQDGGYKMINQRSEGIVNNMNGYVYHILGCGAIGSSAAIQLCRMGADVFQLYDFDKVEEANIGVSQYNQEDIGKHKVHALEEHLHKINPNAVTEICSSQYKDYKPIYIIDGRMGAEHYQQYIIAQPTLSKYKKHWYSDENGSEEPCNAKATSYCSNMSGSFIANAVRKVVTKQPYNEKFSFNFPTMMLQMSRAKS